MSGSNEGRDVSWRSAEQSNATPKAARDFVAEHRRKRRIIRGGQVLMGLGVLVAIQHLLIHLGAFGGQPSGWQDIFIGYPTAVILVLVGAMAAGQ